MSGAGILKAILVLFLLGSGILFLANGLGADIPFVRYEAIEAREMPAGIALVVAGLLLAIFWKTETKRIEQVFFTRTESDGSSVTTSKTTEITTKLDPRE